MDAPPAAPSASELLRQRVRAVFAPLPLALTGNEDAVHRMRVAGRRLRIALGLLADKPGGGRVRKSRRILRDLTRTAGKSRDLDVGLRLLEERLAGPSSPTRQSLRRRLQGARRYARTRLCEELLDIDIARLRRDLRVVVARPGPDVEEIVARLREAGAREGRALEAAIAAVGDRYDPEALHVVRRLARRLRYTAEVGEILRGGDGSAAKKAWKKLQTGLGKLQDHHLLAEWLEEQRRAAAERGDRALAASAAAQKSWAVRAARAFHRDLLEARPGEAVRTALAEAGSTRTAA